MRAWSLVIWLSFLAVADVAVADIAIAGAQPTTITALEVRGTHRIEASAVLARVSSRVGAPLDATQLRNDIRAIHQLAAFDGVAAFVDDTTLVFEVTERPVIRKVLVAGNDHIGLTTIDPAIGLRAGTAADPSAIQRGAAAIGALYRAHGFMFADVRGELVVADPGTVDVRYTIDEHARIHVRDVHFTGNRAIASDQLRGLMVTQQPRWWSLSSEAGAFRRDALDHDLAVIAGHYLDRGYVDIKLREPRIELGRDRKSVEVTIAVEEGERYRFGELRITGAATPGVHREVLARLQRSATFSRAALEAARHDIERYYQDRGYARATVTPRVTVDRSARTVAVALEVVEGKRVFLERVVIRGNTKTRDKVIRRELAIAEGELWNTSQVEASRRRIFQLGFFDDVTIASAAGSSDELIELAIEVHERRSGTAQLGGGLSSAESYVLQGQLAQDNFLGRGQSVSFTAQLSRLRRLFSLRIIEPYTLDSGWATGLELYNTSRGLGAYSRDATGGALTFGRALASQLHASLTYRLENVSIARGAGGLANLGARSSVLPSLDSGQLLRGGVTSSLRAALTFDARDNRLLPKRGWFATGFIEYADRMTGSQNRFIRYGGVVRHYRHLGGPFTLRLNGEFGAIHSLDGRGVPLSERYVLGGIYDVRGYQPRSIGPQLLTHPVGDVGGELTPLTLGGNVQLFANAEIEFPLSKRLGLSGVVFFDIGNAYNLESRWCSGSGGARPVDACGRPVDLLGGLRKSVGIGVRWQSPIGPLRFELGLPLDLRPGEKPSGIDFTIGTSF